MAQVSLPQAGDSVGDSGPYTSDDWARFFEVVFTGDQAATQGILRNHLNELEVTRAGNTISIDTGAGFCYGRWIENDASVDINVTACAGVETRWDRVVLVQNETAAVYNPANLLLPAAYAAGVPRNSCRIAILRGVCGNPGVLPALLTGPNYYMVELARYQVTGGTAGTITDYRGYCEFSTLLNADSIENRTRRLWVPALIGQNWSHGTLISLELAQHPPSVSGPAIAFPDNDRCTAFGRTAIPADWDTSAIGTSTAVLIGAAGGNISRDNTASWGECGASRSSHAVSTGQDAEAISSAVSEFTCVGELAMVDPVSTDDILSLGFQRYGADATDTLGVTIYMLGWIVEYTADS